MVKFENYVELCFSSDIHPVSTVYAERINSEQYIKAKNTPSIPSIILLLIIVTFEFATCSQEMMPKKANLEDLEELRKRPGKTRNS